MAKISSIEKNKRRAELSRKHAARRGRLKATASDRALAPEDRMAATLKLAQMPRNGASIRIRNRCEVSGRARSVYRKFRLSRIALRELGLAGMIPGLVKSSW